MDYGFGDDPRVPDHSSGPRLPIADAVLGLVSRIDLASIAE
jgi:hypothetical protein